MLKKCFIIGGSEIFKQTINFADEMIISRMKNEYPGDVFFPVIDFSNWEDTSQIDFEDFIVHTYIRKEKLNEKVFEADN